MAAETTMSLVVTESEKLGYKRTAGALGVPVGRWAIQALGNVCDATDEDMEIPETLDRGLALLNQPDHSPTTTRTSIAFDAALAGRLDTLCQAHGITRHRLCRAVLAACIDRHAQPNWIVAAADRKASRRSANRGRAADYAPLLDEVAKLYNGIYGATVMNRDALSKIRETVRRKVDELLGSLGEAEIKAGAEAIECVLADSKQDVHDRALHLYYVAGFIERVPDEVCAALMAKAGMFKEE